MRAHALMDIRALRLTEIPGLDPVTVIFEDGEPGTGSLIITCYGAAWTAWWGAIGKENTLRRFVSSCGTDYLLSCLARGEHNHGHGRTTRQQRDYLRSIVEAVKLAIAEEA